MQLVEGDLVEINGCEAWNWKVQSSTDNMLVIGSGDVCINLYPVENKNYYIDDKNNQYFLEKHQSKFCRKT